MLAQKSAPACTLKSTKNSGPKSRPVPRPFLALFWALVRALFLALKRASVRARKIALILVSGRLRWVQKMSGSRLKKKKELTAGLVGIYGNVYSTAVLYCIQNFFLHNCLLHLLIFTAILQTASDWRDLRFVVIFLTIWKMFSPSQKLQQPIITIKTSGRERKKLLKIENGKPDCKESFGNFTADCKLGPPVPSTAVPRRNFKSHDRSSVAWPIYDQSLSGRVIGHTTAKPV